MKKVAKPHPARKRKLRAFSKQLCLLLPDLRTAAFQSGQGGVKWQTSSPLVAAASAALPAVNVLAADVGWAGAVTFHAPGWGMPRFRGFVSRVLSRGRRAGPAPSHPETSSAS